VSQISPPVRIVLVGAVLFLAAWFMVLRPKSDATVAPPAAPAATATATSTPSDAYGRAVAKAKGAAAQTEAAAKRDAGETQPKTQTKAQTGSNPAKTTPAQPPIAIPAKVLATLPHDVAAALSARKTLVLGVIADGATDIRPLADDDRYVRGMLGRVNRYHGQVLVKRVPVGSLVRYAPLVGDLQVAQTPSVVVIDGKLHGTVLTGYVDPVAIDQAIADARGTTIADPYLAKLSVTCTRYYTRVDRWSLPTEPGKAARAASDREALGILATYHGIVARTPAPARWRALKAQFAHYLADRETSLRAATRRGERISATGFRVDTSPAAAALDRSFNRAGVTGCAVDRRS
jgi:hypothetical protein